MKHLFPSLLPVLIVLLLSPSWATDLSTKRFLDESVSPFKVSDSKTYSGRAFRPDALALQDGGFFVTWTAAITSDPGYDSNHPDYNIFGKIYNADGTERTSDFLINTLTYSSQSAPKVAQLPNGNIIVIWWSNSKDQGPNTDMATNYLFRCFIKIDGTKDGEDVMIYQGAPSSSQSIDILKDGRVVYSSAGTILVSDLEWATFTPVDTLTSSTTCQVTALDAGGFAVFWYNDTPGEIYCQLYEATGEKGKNFRVGTHIAHHYKHAPSVLMLPDRNILVTWTVEIDSSTDLEIYVEGIILSQTGDAQESQFRIGTARRVGNNLYTFVLPNGEILVTWRQFTRPFTFDGRQFYANHTAKGDQFVMSTQVDDHQFFGSMAFVLLKNGLCAGIGIDALTGDAYAMLFKPSSPVVPEEPMSLEESSTNVGLIVGLSIGGVVVLLLVGYVAMKCMSKKRMVKQQRNFETIEKEDQRDEGDMLGSRPELDGHDNVALHA